MGSSRLGSKQQMAQVTSSGSQSPHTTGLALEASELTEGEGISQQLS